MLLEELVEQRVLAGTALSQEREDQLLLAVVVRLQEAEDVLVVVGDQRHPGGVAGRDAADEPRGRAEGVPKDAVHGVHVADIGTGHRRVF